MKKKQIAIISISTVAVLLLITIAIFIYNNVKNNQQKAEYYIENHILTSVAQAQEADKEKPMVVVFHANYCKTCHQFMPVFNRLAKEYSKKYNFIALDVQDPATYPLLGGNVSGIPSLYIFDPVIGNKVHISISAMRGYKDLTTELDRYLRIRSYIDLKKAKADHEKLMAEYLKALKKQQTKNG